MATLDHLQARKGPNKARVWYGTPSAIQYVDVPGGSNRQCAEIAAEQLGRYGQIGEKFIALCAVTIIPPAEREDEYRTYAAGIVQKNLERWARENATMEAAYAASKKMYPEMEPPAWAMEEKENRDKP